MNSTSLKSVGRGWCLTLGHWLSSVRGDRCARSPSRSRMRRGVPVRSAHKQRENRHQSKIAACISFPVKNLRYRVRKQDSRQTPAASRRGVLKMPADQGDAMEKSTHMEAAYIHSRTFMMATNSGVDVTILSPAALISAMTTIRPSKLGTIEKATNGNSGSHMAAC